MAGSVNKVIIVGNLGRYHELFVIDRFSTLAYRNRPVTAAEAARELSVCYILEGSVQQAGDRIRVSLVIRTRQVLDGGRIAMDRQGLSPVRLELGLHERPEDRVHLSPGQRPERPQQLPPTLEVLHQALEPRAT